jgi:hypothetical protein
MQAFVLRTAGSPIVAQLLPRVLAVARRGADPIGTA